MPAAGWAQIIFLVGLHELTVAKQDYTKVPGEIPTFLSFKPEDPDVRSQTRAPQWQASLLDNIRRESDLTGAGGARSVDAGRDAAGNTERGAASHSSQGRESHGITLGVWRIASWSHQGRSMRCKGRTGHGCGAKRDDDTPIADPSRAALPHVVSRRSSSRSS